MGTRAVIIFGRTRIAHSSQTKVKEMRCFKTTRYSHLAQFLLEFTEGEQRMKLKGTMIKGYVKQGVLEQYFSDAELRKKYPKAEINHVLDVLVKAGLLEECKHEET